MHSNPIDNIARRPSTWLISLGVFLFAILNSGYNENFTTALQDAVQTEWLASDTDESLSWQIVSTSSSALVLPSDNCYASIQLLDRLKAVAYNVAKLKALNVFANRYTQVGYRNPSKSDFSDSDIIYFLG